MALQVQLTMTRQDERHPRKNLRWCVFHFMVLATFIFVRTSTRAQEQLSHNPEVIRVMALEVLWNQAEFNKDTPALDQLLADNFLYVDIDGSLKNKAEFLESVKKPPEHIVNIATESSIARVYPDTIVISGIYHERGTLKGKGYYRRGRFTDTWVRNGTSWICVASQSTLIQR